MLYLSTPSSRVIALDAETGAEIWKFDPREGQSGKRPFWAHRGVAYWEGASKGVQTLDRRILLGTSDGKLMALNAASGKPVESFGRGGAINLREGVAERWPSMIYTMTSPPAIYKDLVITGAQVPCGSEGQEFCLRFRIPLVATLSVFARRGLLNCGSLGDLCVPGVSILSELCPLTQQRCGGH